jgi:dTDP-4-dehydrorhamnose 3,5-epimerase
MIRAQFQPAPIRGAALIRRDPWADQRGSLERLFEAEAFADTFPAGIKQINRTRTTRTGTVRGAHLQLPPAREAKVVTCLAGSVFDVVVDLRPKSETFGRWWGTTLTSSISDSVLVPEGCAHAVQTLSGDSELLYLHSAPFVPELQMGMNPTDPDLAIEWPLPVAMLSVRDSTEGQRLDYFRAVDW